MEKKLKDMTDEEISAYIIKTFIDKIENDAKEENKKTDNEYEPEIGLYKRVNPEERDAGQFIIAITQPDNGIKASIDVVDYESKVAMLAWLIVKAAGDDADAAGDLYCDVSDYIDKIFSWE